jgi:hypothetical protein
MMKRLFSQAETLGIIPAVGKLNIVTFSKCTTTIRGRLREKLEKCNPPLAEKAKLQLPQHLRRSSLTPTGCLYFEIDPNCIALGKKRRWTESPSRPFDQMICEIVGAVHHALLERMENDRRADDRRELERSARRALWRAQEETQLEESRWAVLVASAQQALELKHVEQLLATFEQDEIENSNIHGDRTTAEWLAWIRAQIIERYKRIANIEETIRRIASLR